MSATVFYFSGTGNSLHVARILVGDGRIVNIAGRQVSAETVCDSGVFGLVFPVHFGDLPGIVEQFAQKAKFTGTPYIFAVATCGAGMPGNTLPHLDRLLRKSGTGLSAGFVLAMPDNAYTGMNLITPPEQRAAILDASERRLAEIAGVIRRKEKVGITGKGTTAGRFVMPVMKEVITRGFRVQRGFRATDRCSGCGICAKICPADNVTVEGKTVKWGRNCAFCLACFHWCPQQAIQLDGKTAGIARYHHPQVTIDDMLSRP